MIYASLPTIRAWNQPLVAPVYLVLALATGGVLVNLLLAVFGYELRWAAIGTVSALVLGAILKRLYWTAIDTARENLYGRSPPPGSASSARCGRSIRRTPSRTS